MRRGNLSAAASDRGASPRSLPAVLQLPHTFINQVAGDGAPEAQPVAGASINQTTIAEPPSRFSKMPPYVYMPILLGVLLMVAALIGAPASELGSHTAAGKSRCF